jgi:cytochrome c-type biogenesis protein
MDHVTAPLAFAAGLVSFLSPCVLPLVPAYVAYLGGRAGRGGDVAVARPSVAVAGLSFVIGLTLVFVLFFYAFQAFLYPVRVYLAPIAGVVVIVFALQIAGILRIPFLNAEYRLMEKAPRQAGPLGGLLLGFGFASGWTPCVGPTLGAILTSGATQGTTAAGLILVLTYCAGLGLPFVAMAVAFERVAPLLPSLTRRRRVIDRVSAAVLGLMGVLLLTNQLTWLTVQATQVWPGWLVNHSTI